MQKTAFLGTAFLVFFGILLFSDLGLRPMHNDEGVNAWFFEKLLTENRYAYDHRNYHGPSLYYIQLLVTKLSPSGITPISIRAGVAAAGILTLAGLLFAGPRIGAWGALTALVVLGSSCGFLFYSRYFIHEPYFILFTLGLYLSSVYFRDTKKPVYFYAACASAALLFATKETSAIVFAMLIGAAIMSEWLALDKSGWDFLPERKHVFGGLVLVFWIWFLLFSSFFTNPAGLWDSLRAYVPWAKTGFESGHEKEFLYYVRYMLVPYDLTALLLGAAGAGAALVTRKKAGLFLFFWAAGLLFAHSLIPYKTPWLIVNFLLPLALLAGFGIQQVVEQLIARRDPPFFGSIFAILIVCSGFVLVRQFPVTLRLLFTDFDNEKHPHIYVHTSRDVYRLVEDIDAIVARAGLGQNVDINVVSSIEWPLPFYLRKYPNARFWRTYEKLEFLPTPLIIAEKKQSEGLSKELKGARYIVRPYLLRIGVPLELWVRRDLLVTE